MTTPRLSVCLTFDFDALSPWVLEMAEGNVAALSRGEFDAVAVSRILNLLERHQIPATFFIPGHTALAYPELVREIKGAGHELGHHGWVHEPLSRLEPARERELLRRGLGALETVADVRPAGYRAPGVDVIRPRPARHRPVDAVRSPQRVRPEAAGRLFHPLPGRLDRSRRRVDSSRAWRRAVEHPRPELR